MFDSPLFTLFAFLMGACIGSFLNVVIYRVPLGLSVNEPKRSFCPTCKKPIPWYHNLPLISWLILRGKCAGCKSRITIRYWLVELLTAVLFMALWMHYPQPGTLLLFAWCALAIVISFIDAEHMVVYPLHTLAGTLAALGAVLVNPALMGKDTWLDGLIYSIMGASAGFILLYIVMQLGKLAFGKKEYFFDQETAWSLKDPETEEEELTLILGEEEIEWSFLFSRPGDKLILNHSTLIVDKGDTLSGEIIITASQITCGDQSFSLEQATEVSGSTRHALIPREAMGSGDPYILGMICALTGVQSIPIILLASCLVGILFALLQRLGFGARIPFGPMLFIGAFFWIFYGCELWEKYLFYFS